MKRDNRPELREKSDVQRALLSLCARNDPNPPIVLWPRADERSVIDDGCARRRQVVGVSVRSSRPRLLRGAKAKPRWTEAQRGLTRSRFRFLASTISKVGVMVDAHRISAIDVLPVTPGGGRAAIVPET